jgi:putative intracellular protease/amidase
MPLATMRNISWRGRENPGKNPGKGIAMGKIAFLVNSRLKNMGFAQTLKSLRDQGHELIRVVPQQVGTSGEKNKKGFESPRKNSEKPAAEKFDALLIFQRYSLDQLKGNKELVEFVADFLESGKPVWTGGQAETFCIPPP